MTQDSSDTKDDLLATLQALKERAELAARAAEEASSKANSESGFAFNAKQNAEDHAKAIAQVRGTVDADFTWLTKTKQNAEELASSISSSKSTVDNDTKIIAELKISSEKEASAIKGASDRVTVLAEAVEKIKSDMAMALKNATADAASVTTSKASADAGAAAIQNLQTQIAEIASKATTDAATITKNEEHSKTLQASMVEIVTTAEEAHERVVKYQNELTQLTTAFNDLHSKVEGLLPNATSAGLASAFRNQKGRFKKPQRAWILTFVVAIALLVFAGANGLPGLWPGTEIITEQESWDVILRHLVTRLPLVAPLVWLAIYAGRHYTLALRVEEEYAFKEAVSTAFEGYKREMANISDIGEGSMPPIVTLCENVLRALAQRPGRIYEGKHEDITPISPFAKAVGDATAGILSVTKKSS